MNMTIEIFFIEIYAAYGTLKIIRNSQAVAEVVQPQRAALTATGLGFRVWGLGFRV